MAPIEWYTYYLPASAAISALITFCSLAYEKEDLLITIIISACAGIFGMVALPFYLTYKLFAIPHKLIGKLGEKYGKN